MAGTGGSQPPSGGQRTKKKKQFIAFVLIVSLIVLIVSILHWDVWGLFGNILILLSFLSSLASAIFGYYQLRPAGFDKVEAQVVHLWKNTSIRMPTVPFYRKRIFEVPYLQNNLFTGREKVLEELRQRFEPPKTKDPLIVIAIGGLRGLGKTAVALEYVYRHSDDYRYILWVASPQCQKSIDICEQILSLLKDAMDPPDFSRTGRDAIEEARKWLGRNSNWLIILDDCGNLNVIQEIIPPRAKGHVLITTETSTNPIPEIISLLELGAMTDEEGASLLLSYKEPPRVRRDSYPRKKGADWGIAEEISKEMGGLPRGIMLAGSYLRTYKPGLTKYLDDFKEREQRAAILIEQLPINEKPIATTWSLIFDKLQREEAGAAELLRFCAFLAAAPIPEEIIRLAPSLPNDLADIVNRRGHTAFDHAIGVLRAFSLIDRSPDKKLLIMPRLVQLVIQDDVYDISRPPNPEIQRGCAEQAILSVNHFFPDAPFEQWKLCQTYLPHAVQCTDYVNNWSMNFPEAIRLLFVTGAYLQECGRYAEAESRLTKAVELRRQVPDPSSYPTLAKCLNALGELQYNLGQCREAESSYKEALSKMPGPTADPQVAIACNYNLARFYEDARWRDNAQPRNEAKEEYDAQQKDKAKKQYAEAIKIPRPDRARSLNQLGWMHYKKGEFSEAKECYQFARKLLKDNQHEDSPDFAQNLAGLATVAMAYKNDIDIELTFREALKISKQLLDANHPQIASKLHSLAMYYRRQGEDGEYFDEYFKEAKKYFIESRTIYEQKFGSDHLLLVPLMLDHAELLEIWSGRIFSGTRKQNMNVEAKDLRINAAKILRKYIP